MVPKKGSKKSGCSMYNRHTMYTQRLQLYEKPSHRQKIIFKSVAVFLSTALPPVDRDFLSLQRGVPEAGGAEHRESEEEDRAKCRLYLQIVRLILYRVDSSGGWGGTFLRGATHCPLVFHFKRCLLGCR